MILQKLVIRGVLTQTRLKWQIFFFMVNEIFTEEIESVKANNEGTLEGFKEKSD